MNIEKCIKEYIKAKLPPFNKDQVTTKEVADFFTPTLPEAVYRKTFRALGYRHNGSYWRVRNFPKKKPKKPNVIQPDFFVQEFILKNKDDVIASKIISQAIMDYLATHFRNLMKLEKRHSSPAQVRKSLLRLGATKVEGTKTWDLREVRARLKF